jgi:prevent-host-death family protein
MKAIQISRDILPVGEFKAHVAEVLRSVRTSSRTVVITQNGKAAAVLISPETFDALIERARFVSAVEAGLADSDAGRLVDDDARDGVLHAALGPA